MMQISGQTNGGKGNYVLHSIHPFLNRSFSEYPARQYFSEIDGFAVLVQVAGIYGDFGGGEGPERLRKPGRDTWLVIDLVIPIHSWLGKTQQEFVSYFVTQLRLCFELMVERSKKRNWLVNEDALRRDFDQVLTKLLAEDFGDWSWGAQPALEP